MMTTPRSPAEKIVLTDVVITPNRIEMAWRHLLSRGDETVEELTSVLGVPALSRRAGSSGRAASSDDNDDALDERSGQPAAPAHIVRAAETLGIFERIGPDSAQRLRVRGGLDNNEAYREYLDAQLVLRDGPQNIAHELSWLLGQDSRAGIEFAAYVGKDLAYISNAARFAQLQYWARYLGLAWFIQLPGKGSQVVIPDPTSAIFRRLSTVLSGDQPVPLIDFLSRAAECLPVLEGGWAREAYERTLPSGSQRIDGTLSLSTAFALRRLDHRGVIKLTKHDDWPKKLIFPDHTASYLKRDTLYTHVERGTTSS